MVSGQPTPRRGRVGVVDAAVEQMIIRRRWTLIGGCTAAVLLMLGLLQLPQGRTVLVALGLRAAQRDLVELYFPDGRGPSNVIPSASTVPVEFVIRVSGEHRVRVAWRVDVGAGATARTAGRGRARVAPAHPLHLRRAVELGCTDARVGTQIPVRVTLAPRPQQILSWVSCDRPAASSSVGTSG